MTDFQRGFDCGNKLFNFVGGGLVMGKVVVIYLDDDGLEVHREEYSEDAFEKKFGAAKLLEVKAKGIIGAYGDKVIVYER